jgi:hypothetical protein
MDIKKFIEHGRVGDIVCLLLTSIYTWYLFRTIFMDPGHLLLSGGGDGLKNYYTYLYHLLYGSGSHFQGMGYPFGEHISYTDNQPALAYPLAALKNYLPISLSNCLSIMHLFMALSFSFCIIYIYKILRIQDVNPILAALFGLLVAAMAPNLFRIFGHFGLSYTCFIPIIFYHLLKYLNTRNFKYLLFIFLLTYFFAFLHFYNLVASIMLVLVYGFICFIAEETSFKMRLKRHLPLIITVVLSFAAVKVTLLITDHITDRPTNPWGIVSYLTTCPLVITSQYTTLGNAFSWLFDPKELVASSEGYCYIGFISILFVIFVLFYMLFKLVNRKSLFKPFDRKDKIVLFTSLIILLFAMGVPFIWNMEFLLDYLGPLKQFRSLGRFSQIFYFLICILSAKKIAEYITDKFKNQKILEGAFMLFVVLSFWTYEIIAYSKIIQPQVDRGASAYKDYFNDYDTKLSGNIRSPQSDDYQCIIGLPFFCIGSEKLGLHAAPNIAEELFLLSMVSHLPMMNTMMSRSSWSNTFALHKLVGGAFSNKDRVMNLMNDKKVMLAVLMNESISENQKYLVKHADEVGKFKNLSLYALDWKKLYQHEREHVDSLNQIPIEILSKENASNMIDHFDELKADSVMFGKGALSCKGLDTVEIMNREITFEKDSLYEFSLWTLVNQIDFRVPDLDIDYLNEKDEKIRTDNVRAAQASDFNGNWYRLSSTFIFPNDCVKLRISLYNYMKISCYAVDEMQFRKVNSFMSFEETSPKLRLYNNHIIKLTGNK